MNNLFATLWQNLNIVCTLVYRIDVLDKINVQVGKFFKKFKRVGQNNRSGGNKSAGGIFFVYSIMYFLFENIFIVSIGSSSVVFWECFWEKIPPCTVLFWSARLMFFKKNFPPARLFCPARLMFFKNFPTCTSIRYTRVGNIICHDPTASSIQGEALQNTRQHENISVHKEMKEFLM